MRGEERRGEGERGRGRKTDWSESSAEGVEREVLSSVRKHEISRHRGGCKNILSGSRKASGALVGGGGGGLVAAPEKARLRLRLPSLTSLSPPPPPFPNRANTTVAGWMDPVVVACSTNFPSDFTLLSPSRKYLNYRSSIRIENRRQRERSND